jgi:hypothetical protein
MLKSVHAKEDAQAAREKGGSDPREAASDEAARAAEIVAASVEETLGYYAMPSEDWRSIKTNNPLERLMREVRRRKRVVGQRLIVCSGADRAEQLNLNPQLRSQRRLKVPKSLDTTSTIRTAPTTAAT